MNLAVKLTSLVFNESLDNPILEFNAVKVLVNDTSNENSLINSIQSNVKNIKSNDINPHMHEIFLQRYCMKWVPGNPLKEMIN